MMYKACMCCFILLASACGQTVKSKEPKISPLAPPSQLNHNCTPEEWILWVGKNKVAAAQKSWSIAIQEKASSEMIQKQMETARRYMEDPNSYQMAYWMPLFKKKKVEAFDLVKYFAQAPLFIPKDIAFLEAVIKTELAFVKKNGTISNASLVLAHKLYVAQLVSLLNFQKDSIRKLR